MSHDRERWKGLCKNRYPAQGDGGERCEDKQQRDSGPLPIFKKSSYFLDYSARLPAIIIAEVARDECLSRFAYNQNYSLAC